MTKANRKQSFWHSEMPLTSKKANLILSKPTEAKALMKAVRASRKENAETKDSIIGFSEGFAEKIAKL